VADAEGVDVFEPTAHHGQALRLFQWNVRVITLSRWRLVHGDPADVQDRCFAGERENTSPRRIVARRGGHSPKGGPYAAITERTRPYVGRWLQEAMSRRSQALPLDEVQISETETRCIAGRRLYRRFREG